MSAQITSLRATVYALESNNQQRRAAEHEIESAHMLGEAFKNPPKIYEPPVGAVSVDRPLEATKPQLAASLASAMAGLS